MRGFPVVPAGAAIAAALSGAAQAQARIDVAPGQLHSTVAQIAARMRVSIALEDATIGSLSAPRVAGTLTAEAALRQAVRGLPVRVVVIDGATFRVIRAAAAKRPQSRTRRPQAPTPAAEPAADPQEVVVTATKRDPRRSRHAGTVLLIGSDDLASSGAAGTEAVARAVTSLNSTHLGAGRDKLFLRGVGDSSYSGQTQATVGQYLGEARLNYTGPDPALRLYDVERVELLLGPQGALYGAGSMGGIMRIEPNRPDPAAASASIQLSGSVTRHGAPGAEAAAVLNLPAGGAQGALRAVGYRLREGGYIDDVARGVRDSDRLDVEGGRLAYALSPAPAWRAEVTGLFQNIDARDADYADRRAGALARSSAVAQPYRNRYRLGSVTVSHDGDALRMVANLSHARAALRDRFDGGEIGSVPRFLDRRNVADVTTGEFRLGSPVRKRNSWMVGAAFVDSSATSRTQLSQGEEAFASIDARSRIEEKTLFGEGSQSIGPVTMTLGLRLVRWDSDAQASMAAAGARPRTADGWAFLPTAGVLIDWAPDAQMFVRHARSYRPPTVVASVTGANRLAGDGYGAWEVGVRLSPSRDRPFDGALTLSRGRWHDVQAEAVDDVGNLTAANIGNARILTVEGSFGWQMSPRVKASGGVTFNDTVVKRGAPSIIFVTRSRLPNIPDVGARLALAYASPAERRYPFSLATTANYVGHSRAGIGAIFDRVQGGYVDWAAEGTVTLRNAALFLRATNLLDTHGSRFALGTIAQVALETQYVPQRPRTVTLGVRWSSSR